MRILATITRRLTLSVIAIITTLLLLVFVLTSALNQTVLNRDRVKEWTAQPETYDLITQSISQSIEEQEELLSETSNNSQAEELTGLIEEYFSADKFTSVTDEIINGVFNWLEGEDSIEFEVQLFDNRQQLKDFFVDAQQLRLNSLEPCTTQQLATSDQSDLFNIDCRPPDVSKQKLEALLNSAKAEEIDELFSETTINSEDLELDQAESDAEQLRAAYQLEKMMPQVLLIATGLMLSLALLIYRDWRKWLRYSGWLLVVLPSLALVAGAVLWHSDALREFAFNSVNIENIDSQLLRIAVEPVVIDFGQAFTLSSLYLVVSGVLALVVVNWQKLRSATTKFKRR